MVLIISQMTTNCPAITSTISHLNLFVGNKKLKNTDMLIDTAVSLLIGQLDLPLMQAIVSHYVEDRETLRYSNPT